MQGTTRWPSARRCGSGGPSRPRTRRGSASNGRTRPSCGTSACLRRWLLSVRKSCLVGGVERRPREAESANGAASMAWRTYYTSTPLHRWRGEDRATERQRIEHTHNTEKKNAGRGRRRGVVLRLRVRRGDGLRPRGRRRRRGRGPRALCGDRVDETRCGYRCAIGAKGPGTGWVVIKLRRDRGLGGSRRDPR